MKRNNYLVYYRGKKIDKLTKAELIEALNVMHEYYETRIEGLKEINEKARRYSW